MVWYTMYTNILGVYIYNERPPEAHDSRQNDKSFFFFSWLRRFFKVLKIIGSRVWQSMNLVSKYDLP